MEPETGVNPPSATPAKPKLPAPLRRAEQKIHSFYKRYEKYSGIAFFFTGFLWDSLTLTRVDNLLDNFILLFYLVLIGSMIALLLRRQNGAPSPKWIQKIESHFPWAMQFCFGGLFSSYVVFYFKSASWSRTQFFFLALVFLLVANEFLQDRLQNPVLLALLYTFCLFSFLAFFLPVILAAVSAWIFLLAGFLSLILSLIVFAIGMRFPGKDWRKRMTPVAAWICGVVLAVNILYFANLIPPVPLALKDAGIYHSVVKTPAGYEVKYVPPPIWQFWKRSDSPFHWYQGEKIYCYTAVFAPARIRRIPVYHVWNRKTANGWVETDRLGFQIMAGGREKGYRGYTSKQAVSPGEWRVDVETIRGQTLGHIHFDVVAGPVPRRPLQTRIL